MSIAITEPSGSASGWVKYVTGGGKEGDRVAEYISDLGDPAATVAAIEAEMSSHRGRTHQGFRLVQSFSMNELDPEDPETPLKVNALGYELASRAAPNSPCVVVTHMDSEGQNPHNHIYVVNHDYATGKAASGAARTAFKLREVNDQLMRDRGMEVTEPGPRALTAMYAKQQQRGERVEPVATVDELTSGTWAEWTANKLGRCLQDERVTDLDSLIEVAGEAGISVRVKPRTARDVKAGRPPSMTYALVDDDGNVRSKGRAKFACGQKKLGTDYSYEGLNATIDTLVKQRAEQARRPAQPVRPVEHQAFGRASQLLQQRMAAMGLGESFPVVEEVEAQEPTPTPKRSAPAAEEPVTAPEPVAPAPAVVEEPVTAQTGAQARRHRQVTEDREPEPVDVDKALQDVLSQSSAPYVEAAVTTKVKGRSLDDRVRARLRRQAERGALPEDRSTAYEGALTALNPKAAEVVDRKVHRAWATTYGSFGTRPGQMAESQFRARRYDGPGSGRTSRLQQQMRDGMERSGRDTSRGRSL